MTEPTTTEPKTRRKSTLFCWECEHTSPIDEDWIRHTRRDGVEYVCPVCETTIAERPRRDGDADRGQVRRLLAA